PQVKLSLLGLPLNAVSLWILVRHHRLKSPSAIFMINLAISDLLLIISLPMRIYYYATGTWQLGSFACISVTMLFRNNLRSSSIFVTCISVDRLLALVYPLRSRHLRTLSNASKAAALIWFLVLVVNLPEALAFSRNLTKNNETSCFRLKLNGESAVPAYLQAVLILILLAVNILCTALVSWTLRRHLSDSAQVKNKIKAMLIFAMNLVMFTVCFLPLSIAFLSIRYMQNIQPLICLASMNCCLDPLLYYFSLDAFWKKKDEDVDLTREQ
uniref:G-protein coupled receptors family 1 profile domain-containing protein n=1 Tax=Anabas testudineus TaxID=64144 RepID=A0A3Q1JF08_ANATE